MARMEQEGPKLESDLARGQSLLQQEHAPLFLQSTLSTLEDRYRETSSLVNTRYTSIQEVLALWEEYEAAKLHVADVVRQAGAEASRSPVPAGQEGIQRELTSKQVGFLGILTKYS